MKGEVTPSGNELLVALSNFFSISDSVVIKISAKKRKSPLLVQKIKIFFESALHDGLSYVMCTVIIILIYRKCVELAIM